MNPSTLRRLMAAAAIIGSLAAPACGSGSRESSAAAPASAPATASPAAAATPVASGRPRVVILGDSLTAGLGLAPVEAYPALIQQRMDTEHLGYEIVNAGVSGDTSAGGLSRLDWALEGEVKILVVALGGNDALRGLPLEELKGNLAQIIERAQAKHLGVVLAGMEAPPNFGHDYAVSFHQIYPDLARKYNIALVPFLLDGVAGIETLNQRDGIHPTAEGARKVADNVWTVLRPMLKD